MTSRRRRAAQQRHHGPNPARPAPTRHRAGVAAYNGDAEHIVGEVKGPTTFGELLVATSATYYPQTHRTIVSFHTLTDDDYATVARTRTPRLEVTPQ